MFRRRRILQIAIMLLLTAFAPAEAQAPAQDTILTVAGGVPNNVSALSISTEAQNVATDGAGNTYSSSPDFGLVIKISPTGQASTFAGNGSLGYGGDGGAATSAQIGCPVGIAFDTAGDAFIADFCHSIIREVSASTGIIETVAGNGTQGYVGDGASAKDAELDQPGGISLDAAGNLFIADSGNNVIREVVCAAGGSCTPPTGEIAGSIYTVAGNGNPGYTGDAASATNATLDGPFGVAADSTGNLFVADTNNSVVREVLCASGITNCSPPAGKSSGFIYTVAGNGTAGYTGDGGPTAAAELNHPSSVFVDTSANLFIADSWNNVIREVTNGVISTVAGDGIAGFSGDGGPAVASELTDPSGISVNAAGDLLVGDSLNNRVREVSGSTISTIAGNGFVGYSGDGGPATNAQFSFPFGLTVGVATDSAGDVFVADSGASTVREVAASTGNIQTIAGNGTFGFSGDGGPAVNAVLNAPGGVALDTSSNIFIADSGNNVIREISVSTGTIQTVVGTSTAGYTGDGGPASVATLDQPSGIALDSAGDLFIADTANNVVREVYCATGASGCTPPAGATAGYIYTVAGNGTPGFSGDGGSATSAELQQPTGVSVDSAEDIFIADSANNVIREVSGGFVNTVAGNGAPGYSGDNGAAPAAMLDGPLAVSVDRAGNVFIADTNNYVLREVVCANGTSNCTAPAGKTPGDIYTIAGDGTPGFSGDGGQATSAELGFALGTAIDSSGDLLFSDYYGNRVRKLTGIASIPAASISVSSLTFATPQVIGAGAESQTMLLSNTGEYPLRIDGIGISGDQDFTQNNQCGPFPATISPGGSCAITATFQASSIGPHVAMLTIADSAANSPQSVPLSGAGIDFSVGPATGASTSATISAGEVASYALQVSASGGFTSNDQVSVSIACTGAPLNSICTNPSGPIRATAGAPGTFAVQVSSILSSTAGPHPYPWSPEQITLPLELAATVLVLFLLWNRRHRLSPRVQKTRTRIVFTGVLAMLAISAVCLAGCASVPAPQIAPGTYNLSVQATSAGIVRTAKLTLIVR